MFSYAFALQQAFSREKVSTYLAILKRVVEADIKHNSSIEVSFGRYRDYLLQHAVERPPMSVGIFAAADVQALLDHMVDK